jgi:hypothetical protein
MTENSESKETLIEKIKENSELKEKFQEALKKLNFK